ncbi:MAG: type II toxin-antitoxin system prevent-host-death family antitoxin [Anaerolineae bacterium]|nr:type II toxin-antitoxin system prevent-host-death family antitoxin [Anaerolineae bacterium]MBL8104267.1 type II toxin-antitoxin system prevent-host-death family antitoxin [Anaerolineales bacterium]MCC7189922.1 type II toxin-antitoxin system prevent-host-death family antitoxin [Anaerolineales bacterium]
MAEMTVGVRDFKARLGYYLAKAKKGQIINVTSHGKSVARIFPPNITLEERVKTLQQAGIIAWSGQKLPRRKPVAINRGKKLASDLVVEMRNESVF